MPKDDPKAGAASLPHVPTEQFIAGEWRKGGGAERAVTSPGDGRHLATIHDATESDLDDAVAAAAAAQAEWADAGPVARGKALKAAAQRLRDNIEDLALIDALDCGNPLQGMKFDVGLGTTLMEYFAGLTSEVKGETIPQAAGKLTYVTPQPIGVVARLVPFNHPFMFACAKIAAPLAAGNAVILKPSEETPLAALRMAEIIADLFPKGLLSVVTGAAGLGAAICGHKGIGAVGLIGSVTTGRAVVKGGADTLKRTQLELGGKNALVICEDADVGRAVQGAVKGMNLGWTAGQSCGSTSRVLVHESHYDRVVEEIAKAFDAVKLGDPALETTQMGCMSTSAQYDKVCGFIERAKASGARIAAGGAPEGVPEEGLFVRPTLVCDVDPDAEVAREEIFGPVLTILKWRDEAEMLGIVNGLDVGLTASIWTQDLNTAMRLSGRIEAGYVWINDASDHYLGAPFGGVKQSGIGREECLGEMLAYTENKTVTVVVPQ